MKRVLIIGGGASGLTAGIFAARRGAAVTILEAMEKPGKKLLITGNGKCNLTNLDFSREDIYRSEQPDKVSSVLKLFSNQDTISFFESIGLLVHEKNGGIYPITDQASSVVELLISEARRLKVKIKCNEKVTEIKRDTDGFHVSTSGWTYDADKVILACGSKSYPATGSDGSGYELAASLGLTMIEPQPALVPLIIKENLPSKFSGIRSQAKITLTISDRENILNTYSEAGEVQWTDYGVSGIVIFQLSRFAVTALQKKYQAALNIDVLPDYSTEMLLAFLKNRPENKTISEVLYGILPKKMIPVMIGYAGLKSDQKMDSISDDRLKELIYQIKNIHLTIRGSKSFDMAQVCQGGISLNEIKEDTMELIRYPGIFITGELLDVDGICGGYNLQWAFSTGYLAGTASTE